MRASLLVAAIAPLTFALPAALEERESVGATNIVNAITNVQNQISTLTADLNAFHSSDLTAIAEVLTIQQQTDTLSQALQNATAAAKASKKLSDADSGTVAIAVLNLSNNVGPLLNLLVSKKPDFDSAILGIGSVSPQVESDLKNQKKLTNQFATALKKKLSPTYAALAPQVIKPLNQKFNKAIKVFATSGGVFALPPLPNFAAFSSAVDQSAATGALPAGLPSLPL